MTATPYVQYDDRRRERPTEGRNSRLLADRLSYRRVLIEHCWFRTGDDSVVVKLGRDRDGGEIGRPSEHVVVRHNDMGGEDGIALGS